MFRRLGRYFGVGLATVTPFALVIVVIFWIFNIVDGIIGPYVDHIGGTDFPGIGFLIVIAFITLVGALTRLYISHRFLAMMDHLFTRIPLVKSLYSMFKEIVQNLSGRRRAFRKAVLVAWPDDRAQVLGFLTRETLPRELDPEGTKVAVYLPNSFQFAGLTVLVDRAQVKPCDLSVEDAFKFSLSGGLGHAQGNNWEPPAPPTAMANDAEATLSHQSDVPL